MSTAHVHPGRLPRGPPSPGKSAGSLGYTQCFPPPCDATGPLTCPIPATWGRTSHGGFPLRHTRHQMSLHVRMHKHTQHTCALTHTLLSTRQQAESLGWSCRSPSPSPRAPQPCCAQQASSLVFRPQLGTSAKTPALRHFRALCAHGGQTPRPRSPTHCARTLPSSPIVATWVVVLVCLSRDPDTPPPAPAITRQPWGHTQKCPLRPPLCPSCCPEGPVCPCPP